jgi:hypothetical protein
VPDPRIRILIEHENPRILSMQRRTLREAGYVVEGCGGPNRQPERCCPLVDGRDCPKAEAADVIINGLPLGRLRVYAAATTRLPDRPVILMLTDEERSRLPVLEELTVVIGRNSSGPALVDAVSAVTGTRPVRPWVAHAGS